MVRNIISGIAVGVANIIPGVSGGTMLVILGLFDKVTESISNVFKFKNPNRFKDILFLLQVLIGAGIGIVGFAKVLDWLFANCPTQTIYWFIGLILLSIPTLIKSELKEGKFSWISFIIGLITIFVITYFKPENQDMTITNFPPLTAPHLIIMVLAGIIAGATMILPGVSGSMMLLIIGQYYLFKSYVSKVTSFKLDIIIPLCFIGFGIGVGILLSSWVTTYFLKTKRTQTVSFIIGLVVASTLVLIPINISYDIPLILTSAVSLAFGSGIVLFINKLRGEA
ncbi:MAG: DUF368 domain-containing protein [Clostridium sp.]|nr:DUF368 domain-containing protein [Clostridium sp.]